MAKRATAARVCRLIQLYVRLLETDVNGYGYCCSCGKLLSWQECQGGHFQPKGRNYNAAAFEEDNVHVQCAICNCTLGGNPAGYTKYMTNNYGKEAIAELETLSHKYLDISKIQELAGIYKTKCRELAKKKNFKVNI